jgi:Ca-activated chloride channel family protein
LNIQTDRAYVPPDATVTRYLLVQVTAPARRQHTERPPAEVALVLDRSGSMAGRKIEMAKKAVNHAIQLLGPRDRLAIVTYDTEVDTLLEATEAVQEAKALAISRLQAIDARGGTDLHAGWARGAALLAASPAAADVTRRVLLLSDGQANEGETNPEALARYAAELRTTGIATTTFGLGADFDEQLMSSLSTQGGGNFYFIEHPAQIPDFFASELGETLEVVARDVALVLSAGPQVQFTCLNQFRVERAPHASDLRIQLGDLVAEQQITIIVAVRCTTGHSEREVAITACLEDREQAMFGGAMPIEWRVVDGAQDAAQPISLEVLRQVATMMADGARAKAVAANRAGDYAVSRVVIREAAAAIRALAPNLSRLDRVADELEAELHQYERRMDEHTLKSTHFSMHSALRSRTAQGRSRRKSSDA